MTSELVERLRIEDARYPGDTLYGAAADEIERLTAQLAEARQAERAAVDAFERAKEQGVRAGIEAAAERCFDLACSICLKINGCTCDYEKAMCRGPCRPPTDVLVEHIRALDAAAIAKGV